MRFKILVLSGLLLAGCSSGLEAQLSEARAKTNAAETAFAKQSVALVDAEKKTRDLQSLNEKAKKELDTAHKMNEDLTRRLAAEKQAGKKIEKALENLIQADEALVAQQNREQAAQDEENARLAKQAAEAAPEIIITPSIGGEENYPAGYSGGSSPDYYSQGVKYGYDAGVNGRAVPPSYYTDYANGSDFARGYLDGYQSGLKAR